MRRRMLRKDREKWSLEAIDRIAQSIDRLESTSPSWGISLMQLLSDFARLRSQLELRVVCCNCFVSANGVSATLGFWLGLSVTTAKLALVRKVCLFC